MSNGFCTTGLRRVMILMAMALLLSFAAACGGEGEQDCEDNETFATDRGGENACLLQCESDDQCAEGRECDSRDLCTLTGEGPDEEEEEEEEEEEVDELDPADQELCEDYCYLVYGCLNDTCTNLNNQVISNIQQECITGDPTDPEVNGCVADVEANRADYQALVYGDGEGNIGTEKNTCDFTKEIRCGDFGLTDQCSCTLASSVGAGCVEDNDCDQGDLNFGVCLEENDDEEPIDGGLCLIGRCGRVMMPGTPQGTVNYASITAFDGCGEGNACISLPVDDQGGTVGICEQLCEESSDCREDDGFVCQVAGEMYDQEPGSDSFRVGPVRSCAPACEGDDDCGGSARCDVDSGLCQLECDDDGEALCGELGGACTDFEGTDYCDLNGEAPDEPACTEANQDETCTEADLGFCNEAADENVCVECVETVDCGDAALECTDNACVDAE